MHTTIRRYTMGAGSVEDLVARVEEGFVPLVSDIPGFQGYYLVDAGGGAIATVSVFDDRSGSEESDRRAAEWVAESLAEFQLSSPEITEGEVLVSHPPSEG